jgi:branched-chain amino acid transport system substrate-binding protein
MRPPKPLLVALLLTLGSSLAYAEDQIVKIGHVAPLSGQIAHLGKDNENGARMAIDALNAKGIKLSGRTVKFVLLSEDDGASPQQATTTAQKLVDAKVNGVIGHLNSGTTIPASKIYNDAGIPQISPSATNPQYTLQGYAGAFRVVANDSQLGGALGRYAANPLKIQKAAIIDDRTAYGKGVADEFVKAAKAEGINVVAREYTTDKATDLSPILTKIKSKSPDLIFFGGMDAVAGPMLRQMKELGIAAKVMGGDGICTEQLASLSGIGLADGQVVCAEAGGVEDSQKKPIEKFRADYKQRFGVEVKLYGPYVYDAVMVMAAAMQKANSAEPAKYLPELAKIRYQGITGAIEFDAHGDMKQGTLTLYTYQAGKRSQLAVVK